MKKILIILFLLICSSVVTSWGITPRSPPPLTMDLLENIFCEDNGNCSFANLYVANLSVDNLTVANVNVTSYEIVNNLDVDGNVTVDGSLDVGNNVSIITDDGDIELRIKSEINKHAFLYIMEAQRLGFRLWNDGSGINIFKFDAIDGDDVIPQMWFNRDTAHIDIFANIDAADNNITAEYYYGSGAYLTELNVSGNVSVGGDLDMTGYRLTSSYLSGVVGGIDMRGDPWYLSGTGLWIDDLLRAKNLNVDNNLVVGGNITANNLLVENDFTVLGNVNLSDDLFINDNVYIGDCIFDNGIIGTSGNLCVDRVTETHSGLWSSPFTYGFMQQSQDSDFEIFALSLTGTAQFDGTNYYICDYVNNPFNTLYIDKFLTVISSTPNYAGGTGEIEDIVNSSCIRINIAAAGGDLLPDATSFNYVVYPHPRFSVLDHGGYVGIVLGDSPDAIFEIHSPNSTGVYSTKFEDTAGANQHRAVTIDQDINNKEGAIALKINSHSNIPVNNKNLYNTILEIDSSNFNNSNINFMTMNIIGNTLNTKIDGINIDARVEHIIHMGSTDTVDKVYYQGVNITKNVTTPGLSAQVFTNDNDYLYVGNTLNFTSITIDLSVVSSQPIDSLFYYCDRTETWKILPAVSSTMGGFIVSGSINFLNPSDRGKCNKQVDGTPFSDTTKYSYIAIQRTRNNLVTPPKIDIISISGASEYFFLQKDAMKLNPIDTAPIVCPGNLGAIYYDISEDSMCQCKSTGWFVIEDGTACT